MSLTRAQQNGLLTLTLDRPDKRNAFDEELIAQLSHAYQQAGQDPSVSAVLLRASGSHFSAGGDLTWMQRQAQQDELANRDDARALALMLASIDRCPKPTLARVQGPAFAGAVGILACCDIVLSVPDAVFAITEVRIGLIPAVISPYLVRAMGQRQARRWCLTAERFSAEIAQSLGLVHLLLAEPELDGAIEALFGALSQASPAALAATKQLLFDVDRPIDADLIELTAGRIAAQRASIDGR